MSSLVFHKKRRVFALLYGSGRALSYNSGGMPGGTGPIHRGTTITPLASIIKKKSRFSLSTRKYAPPSSTTSHLRVFGYPAVHPILTLPSGGRDMVRTTHGPNCSSSYFPRTSGIRIPWETPLRGYWTARKPLPRASTPESQSTRAPSLPGTRLSSSSTGKKIFSISR